MCLCIAAVTNLCALHYTLQMQNVNMFKATIILIKNQRVLCVMGKLGGLGHCNLAVQRCIACMSLVATHYPKQPG